ncbi:MAG: HAMP domain-containing histidine kinase [Thermoleophilia bacterium]|nr:HAMP domain-containing histidine kinase [Thermoleophilia bacterium]
MSRLHGPRRLRARLFVGMAATVAVSIVVVLVVGLALTRRSLDEDALRALTRQVNLIAAQHVASPLPRRNSEIGRFLATEEERLAILTPVQAELLLPGPAAARLRETGRADGTVDVRGEPFRYAARLAGGDAIVLLRSARNQSADWTPFLLGLALAALLGLLLAAGVAFLLARAVARPVTRVAAASRLLAEGDNPDPLPVEGSTELRQLASSFNELSQELHRAQDAERAFLLSVSHELKTPLTAIRGHAEGLSDGIVSPERAGEVIERETRRLERLIRDLLDLARLRRRSFDVVLGPVDLGSVADEAVARHAHDARLYGVCLESRVEPGAGAIADAGRTLQALSNLTENAIRCTPRGGTVVIEAAAGRLSVVDDGPGLAADDLARAFERFYLWDRYGADRPVGTGLGLAIVAELADAMGGRVTVESTPGAGSTFSLVLDPATLPAHSSGPHALRTAYAALKSGEHVPPSV